MSLKNSSMVEINVYILSGAKSYHLGQQVITWVRPKLSPVTTWVRVTAWVGTHSLNSEHLVPTLSFFIYSFLLFFTTYNNFNNIYNVNSKEKNRLNIVSLFFWDKSTFTLSIDAKNSDSTSYYFLKRPAPHPNPIPPSLINTMGLYIGG